MFCEVVLAALPSEYLRPHPVAMERHPVPNTADLTSLSMPTSIHTAVQVSLSSLNRHAVATRADVGLPKATVLKRHFATILPEVLLITMCLGQAGLAVRARQGAGLRPPGLSIRRAQRFCCQVSPGT